MKYLVKYLLIAAALWLNCTPTPASATSDQEVTNKGQSIKFNFAGYPDPGPIEHYKGKLLVGSKYPDVKNTAFFENIKFAINLTNSLPPKLRKDIDLIKVIIYDPPSKHRAKNDAFTNTTGVYTIGPDLFQPAPVILYRDPKWVAPVNLAYSLVGNSVSARRHRTMMDLKLKMDRVNDKASTPYKNLKAEFDEMQAAVLKTDQAIVDKYRCKPMLAVFSAMKIWEKNPKKRDAMARNLSSRNCL